MLFRIKPLDVNSSLGSWNDCALEAMYSFFSSRKGLEFYECTSHKALISLHEFDIENSSISFKEFPDIILIPADGKVTDVYNEFDSFELQFLSCGDRAIRPFSIWVELFIELIVIWIEFLFLTIESRLLIGVFIIRVISLSSLFFRLRIWVVVVVLLRSCRIISNLLQLFDELPKTLDCKFWLIFSPKLLNKP